MVAPPNMRFQKPCGSHMCGRHPRGAWRREFSTEVQLYLAFTELVLCVLLLGRASHYPLQTSDLTEGIFFRSQKHIHSDSTAQLF